MQLRADFGGRATRATLLFEYIRHDLQIDAEIRAFSGVTICVRHSAVGERERIDTGTAITLLMTLCLS